MRGGFRGWVGPWAASATTALFVFAVLHQFLVEPVIGVFVGLPAVLVLSVPIVLAYARICRDRGDQPSGLTYGLVISAGLVPHYVLITVGMWDRTFDDGPRSGWDLLAIGSAPLVSGFLAWFLWRSPWGTAWLVVGVLIVAVAITGFQESEPDWRNVGAFVSMITACVVAGWVLDRTATRQREKSALPALPLNEPDATRS